MSSRQKRSKLMINIGVLSVFVGTVGLAAVMANSGAEVVSPLVEPPVVDNQVSVLVAESPKIQVAILLDTSSSMDGLIDQARNQLWQVVNEFSMAKKNGLTPKLEVAVFEYGNDGLSSRRGFTRQVIGLTADLDRVSEALYSLTTNGGSEYCGYAIQSAVNELAWTTSDDAIKTIFIAGNEPFTQGNVSYKNAIMQANSAGIRVNTIHAGDYDVGVSDGWQAGALLAGGNFMSINHNQQVVHIVAPQDKEIALLNQQLNETYVPYGDSGRSGVARQMKQDANSNDVSIGMLAKRAKTKASSFYDSSEWDLVDALEKNKLELTSVDERALPSAMQGMNTQEKVDYITEKSESRKQLKEQISNLAKQRDEYVVDKKREQAESEGATIDSALIDAIRAEAKKKAYSFQE